MNKIGFIILMCAVTWSMIACKDKVEYTRPDYGKTYMRLINTSVGAPEMNVTIDYYNNNKPAFNHFTQGETFPEQSYLELTGQIPENEFGYSKFYFILKNIDNEKDTIMKAPVSLSNNTKQCIWLVDSIGNPGKKFFHVTTESWSFTNKTDSTRSKLRFVNLSNTNSLRLVDTVSTTKIDLGSGIGYLKNTDFKSVISSNHNLLIQDSDGNTVHSSGMLKLNPLHVYTYYWNGTFGGLIQMD